MHRLVLSCVLAAAAVLAAHAQAGPYRGGNGTVLETRRDGDILWTLRKHVQRVQVGDLADEENLHVYSQPDSTAGVRVAEIARGDSVDIREMGTRQNRATGETSTWLKITTARGKTGWIPLGGWDPYADGTWTVIETLRRGGKTWTVRKLEMTLAVWDPVDVRDGPGQAGTTVLFRLVPPKDNPQLNVRVTAVTEEFDEIDGARDRWVRVMDAKGRACWLFGDDGLLMRGGPKYDTPESAIAFRLGYY